MNVRNQGKVTMHQRCKALMEKDASLCGDNPHKLTQILVKEQFGVDIPQEQIQFIVTLASARRKVFKDNPSLDKRQVTIEDIKDNDKEFYGKPIEVPDESCSNEGCGCDGKKKYDPKETTGSLFE